MLQVRKEYRDLWVPPAYRAHRALRVSREKEEQPELQAPQAQLE